MIQNIIIPTLLFSENVPHKITQNADLSLITPTLDVKVCIVEKSNIATVTVTKYQTLKM